MTPKDQDTIEVDLHVANDERTDDATGEDDANQLSLTVKLIPIVRLLAKQAARDLYQAANDDRDTDQEIPGE
ncbi:MAG: hypothetical protein OEU92_31425 [Alphaproteobacteria bacterium]|nr:hypothetical protein [Alphaproteobacteria bacterium]